ELKRFESEQVAPEQVDHEGSPDMNELQDEPLGATTGAETADSVVESASSALDLVLDINVDDLVEEAELASRFGRLEIPEFQPDNRVPFLNAKNAMALTFALDRSVITPESLVVYGALRETEDCNQAFRFLQDVTPSQRQEMMSRVSQSVVIEPLVKTDHIVLVPDFDDERGLFDFPPLDLVSGPVNLTEGHHAIYEISGTRIRGESNQRCRYISQDFMSMEVSFGPALELSPLIANLSTADRISGASTRNPNRTGERLMLARVVSEPSGTQQDNRGRLHPVLSPVRIHFYGGTEGAHRSTSAARYLISYDVGAQEWYYDLPVIDQGGRETGRERILVSAP
ncbi:hypothetical protein, partial [Roseinatronobacter sp. NSM]|uniref:hypothetical protein n=1 Tax=Roseinatronobacter sp. NSM TaxID=3457785 RepID=UPI004034F8E0